MKYLLDTNIVSEMRKSNCNPKVKAFTDGLDPEDMYISSISIGEISYGMEKLPAGKKKHDLAIWLYSKLPEWFNQRIIFLDTDAMTEWGRIRAHADRTMPVVDMMIAAAAITHHMTLVTRNIKDFDDVEGIMLINPWEF
ncbi:MAG: type II toxin-antitoxin system VapC family toxin [Treponema sp.]|nr:type II toxin-antitoxin system VapC family toxin [Treponema sp.]